MEVWSPHQTLVRRRPNRLDFRLVQSRPNSYAAWWSLSRRWPLELSHPSPPGRAGRTPRPCPADHSLQTLVKRRQMPPPPGPQPLVVMNKHQDLRTLDEIVRNTSDHPPTRPPASLCGWEQWLHVNSANRKELMSPFGYTNIAQEKLRSL